MANYNMRRLTITAIRGGRTDGRTNIRYIEALNLKREDRHRKI